MWVVPRCGLRDSVTDRYVIRPALSDRQWRAEDRRVTASVAGRRKGLGVFQIKICGITNVADAEMAVASGADAIGLNFYAKSSRYVSAPVAADIVAAVGEQVSVVGVFVNASFTGISQIADSLLLDYVQLHGDEPPELLQKLAPRQVVRALRLRPGGEQAVFDFLADATALSARPAAVLIDACKMGSFGGTGDVANWSGVSVLGDVGCGCPIVLAGGLDPSNVREAIERTECDGVDVASGVEAQPGKKDAAKTRRFVELARSAFQELAARKSA